MANISEEKWIEMLEKKADGTYIAKYPKVKSKSGVTFDEHLAEIATETELGHIKVLSENIDQDGLLVIPVVWEKIADVTLTSNVAQVNFENIPSDYKELKLIFNARNTNSTLARQLLLRFNADTGNNYRFYQTSAVTGTSSIQLGTIGGLTGVNGNRGFGEVLISNLIANARKNIMAEAVSHGDVITTRIQIQGQWLNTTSLINAISLLSSEDQIASGSRFVLMGVK